MGYALGKRMMIDDNQKVSEQEVLLRLASDDPFEQRAAAFEAADMLMYSAIDLLVALFQSSNLGVQEAAEVAIRKIRGPVAIQELIPILQSEEAHVRNTAMDILREICNDDIQALTKLLSDKNADLRIFVSDILGSSGSSLALLPLCRSLRSDIEVNVRYQAAISLGSLGFQQAVPTLCAALDDEEWVQFAVMEALAKIKDDSCVTMLIAKLGNCSPLVASTVIDALGEINSIKSAPLLLKYIDNSSGPLRNKAVKAIIQILGPSSLSLLSAKQLETLRTYMLSALSDDDEDLVRTMMVGLGAVGSAGATEAVFELISTMDPNKDEDLLQDALHCITAMGYNNSLSSACLSEIEHVSLLAVEACGLIGTISALNALRYALPNLNSSIRLVALKSLASSLGKSEVSFFLDLLENTQDPVEQVEIIRFFARCNDPRVSEKLYELLQSYDFTVVEAALDATLQSNDEVLLNKIITERGSEDEMQRLVAVYVMAKMNVRTYLDELAVALQDPMPDIRKVAMEAIGYDGDLTMDEKKKYLEPCLHDQSKDVRLALIGVLGYNINDETLAILFHALEEPDEWVKLRAIEAISNANVELAIPIFIQMLDTNGTLIQLKLIDALGRMGGDLAFQTLLGLMDHENPEIQIAATDAVAFLR